MAHADGAVLIKAPIDKVFTIVSDGLHNPKWRPGVVDIALVEGELGKIGATYSQGMRGPGGRRISGDYRVVDIVPNQALGFQVISGPAHPRGRYTFEAVENGTKVTFALDLETKNLQRLLDPVITATMRREVACLANLKSYLETAA